MKLCKLNGKTVGLHKVIFGAVIILVLVVGLRDYRAFMGEEEYKALLMKDTAAALSAIEPEDIVLYNFDQVQAVTSYYMDEKAEEKHFQRLIMSPLKRPRCIKMKVIFGAADRRL